MLSRIFALYLVSTSIVFAHTLSLSLEDLDQAMDGAAAGGNSLQQFTVLQLQEELDKLDIAWQNGQIEQSVSVADRELDGGCVYSASMRDFDGTVSIHEDTSVGLSLSSLNEPFSVALSLTTDFDATAHIDQNYGVRFLGNCYKYAQDGFNVKLDGTLDLSVDVTVIPHYEVSDKGLLFTPKITVSSNLDHLKYKLNVSKTILEKPLELLLREVIDDEISNKKLRGYARRLQAGLVKSITTSWGSESLLIQLPELGDQELSKLLSIVDLPLFTDLGEALIRDHLPELFYALLTKDSAASTSFASSLAICELLQSQTVTMSKSELYRLDGNACVIAPNTRNSGERFTDAACLNSAEYIAETPADYCEELMDPTLLGNAAASVDLQGKWTLSNSTRLNAGVRTLSGKRQPYMRRVNYRQIDLPVDGSRKCELEMRIFKNDIAATGLKPLLSFHGGSWTFRRSGVIGLEAQVSHLTDKGFVVFEAFYRLTGDDEGSPECHNATGQEVLEDAEAALEWVLENAPLYGATGSRKVAVTGQSAGAHMAAWLMVHRSLDVSRGLLLYPPTDFAHFIGQYQTGSAQTETQGLSAIKRFIGKPVSQIELDDPLVVQNSFPQIIAKQPSLYPPAFIVHGSGDTLVPVEQATRLCGAYNGNAESIVMDDSPNLSRYVEKCGDQGELHIITDAEHALDVCLFDAWCLAGNTEAQKATRVALELGSAWLNK